MAIWWGREVRLQSRNIWDKEDTEGIDFSRCSIGRSIRILWLYICGILWLFFVDNQKKLVGTETNLKSPNHPKTNFC